MRDDLIAVWIVFGLTVVFGVWGILSPLIKRHRTNRRILQEWKKPFKQTPLTERHVYVVEKYMVSEVAGHKNPKHRNVFYVTVRLDNGNTDTYQVDKEIYRTIKEHTSGTLAFLDKRVYGYCED